MKLIKILLVFGMLCKSIDAKENKKNEKHVSFSVEKIWKSYGNNAETCTCPADDASWKKGVQDHYTGCRTATWTFRGEAYYLADTVVNSLQEYITKLIYFANTNSTIVAPSSTAILKSLSRCSELNRSSLNIIFEFEKALPAIIEEFNEIASKLSDHIGDLTHSFNKALSDLGSVFFKFMRDFLESCRLLKCKRRVNYKLVLKKGQKLMNTVALIGETLLNQCESEASEEVYESVLVLHLLQFYFAIAVPGINSCYLDVLYDRCLISKSAKSSALSFDHALIEITQAFCAVVFPFDKSFKDLITVFVDTTMNLNTELKDRFGVFSGVETTVEEIAKHLVKDNKVRVSADKGSTSIVKGVNSKYRKLTRCNEKFGFDHLRRLLY